VKTDIFRPADDDGLDVYDGRGMKTRRRDETSKLPSHISQARARPPRLPNNSPFPHESLHEGERVIGRVPESLQLRGEVIGGVEARLFRESNRILVPRRSWFWGERGKGEGNTVRRAKERMPLCNHFEALTLFIRGLKS